MYLRLLVLLLLPLLSSCTPPDSNVEAVSRRHSNEPDIRLNPNPVHAHRVTVTLNDAPGPFRLVDGVAHYSGRYEKKPNIPCSYRLPLVGVNVELDKSDGFVLKQVSENVYEGTAYSDRVLDEDYGKGRCLWKMTGIRARLRANDNLTDTRFAPYLNLLLHPEIKSVTRYFWKGRYPRASMEGYVDFGHSEKTRLRSELRDELFTITISIKDVP